MADPRRRATSVPEWMEDLARQRSPQAPRTTSDLGTRRFAPFVKRTLVATNNVYQLPNVTTRIPGPNRTIASMLGFEALRALPGNWISLNEQVQRW